MTGSAKSEINSTLLATRWAMAAAGVGLGVAGGLLFGFFALVSLVAFNVVYIVFLAPMLFAFWQLFRWGISKYAMRNAVPYYAHLSIGLRALMAAFLAGLARLALDMARLDAGTDLSGVDGLYALLFVLLGGVVGAGGAAYNNRQHRHRSPGNVANAD